MIPAWFSPSIESRLCIVAGPFAIKDRYDREAVAKKMYYLCPPLYGIDPPTEDGFSPPNPPEGANE
jgi:hypothetical protein